MSLSAVRLALVALAGTTTVAVALSDPPVPFPEGYRRWTHVSTTIVGPGTPRSGMRHVYANELALQGYRTGNFPDGSVLVFDVLEAQVAGNVTRNGNRILVDVMLKNSETYAATGGWGFETFRGDSRTERVLTPQAAAQCFTTCHTNRAATGYVFGTYRD